MPPTISVWHYMCSYACACKLTPLKASYIPVHVWHRLTSHVRRGLGSICEYQHLTLGRVASVGSLDMIGPQRPGLSAAEGDAVFTLFERLLHTMRHNDYMTRLTATPKSSQDVMLFHQSNWCKFVRSAEPPWLAMTDEQKRNHLRRWLFIKFSVDVHNLTMFPDDPNARRLSNSGWTGFHMTDAELEGLVNDIFPAA